MKNQRKKEITVNLNNNQPRPSMDIKKPYYQDEYCTIYNSDCRDILPYLRGFGAVITDPPFNVGKNYGAYSDDLTDVQYEQSMREIVSLCRVAANNQGWVVPRNKLRLWLDLLPDSHLVIVRRAAQGPIRHSWSDQYTPVLAAGRPTRKERDLWDDIRLPDEGYFFREDTLEHPGYTPLHLMMRLIDLLGGNGIIDPFAGTGTSLLAARRLGIKAVGIEVDERWCDVAAQRMKVNQMLWEPERGGKL
ncbi:MAG: DNA methyltransferase [Thermodesulfovibrionales bacterium]